VTRARLARAGTTIGNRSLARYGPSNKLARARMAKEDMAAMPGPHTLGTVGHGTKEPVRARMAQPSTAWTSWHELEQHGMYGLARPCTASKERRERNWQEHAWQSKALQTQAATARQSTKKELA